MFKKKETNNELQNKKRIIPRMLEKMIWFHRPKVPIFPEAVGRKNENQLKIYPIFSEGRENHDAYEKKGDSNVLSLDLHGTPEEREPMLREIAKRFGATSAYQTLYGGADLRSCYDVWDENNGMLSSVQSDGITIVFTFKAAENVLGKYIGWKGWDKKKVRPSGELAKKYNEDASDIYEFTANGSMFKAIEKILREGVEVAKGAGADVMDIWRMIIGLKSTTLEIRFFKKDGDNSKESEKNH